MKPLPPANCAAVKLVNASATTGIPSQVSSTQPSFVAFLSAHEPPRARPTPTAESDAHRSSSSDEPQRQRSSCCLPEWDWVASARKVNRIGTQMPSLRPLSTFRPSRTVAGTAGFVTTALPSAASVGASIVARIATRAARAPGKSSRPVADAEQDRERQPDQQQS